MKKRVGLLVMASFSMCFGMKQVVGIEKFVEAIKNDESISKTELEFIENITTLKDDIGRTLVHWAALYGRIDLIKWLIGLGANLGEIDKNGYAPIHLATLKEQYAIVKILLNEYVDTTLKSPQGTYREIEEKNKEKRYLLLLRGVHEGTCNIF